MNLGRIPTKTAAIDPTREALIDIPNNRRISFGELDGRVQRLANGLRGTLALKKGDRVAILSKNCIQYMEIFFACARCGLIAQPLNWRLSELEMARILRDGEPSLLIGSEDYATLVDSLAKETTIPHSLVFTSDASADYEQLISGSAAGAVIGEDEVIGADPALILYTGGTT